MSRPIIEIQNISKCYKLGQFNAQTLRDEVRQLSRKLWRKDDTNIAATRNTEFWALRDISLSISAGEVVGIVGRNGAGKSTLLKILSRITSPTSGQIRIRGRVASLLEVGTGFHPELTGRENIYLNGTILGMTRAEIASKFDEIVAFAETEQFLDTPVKRYSSGMAVRLAFAVAAHLEPEILVVDEVLAVGDIAFQDKCLGKMREVSRSGGRTVLFVSHNMGAIQSLCNRAAVLDKGSVVFEGSTDRAVQAYLTRTDSRASGSDLDSCPRSGTAEVKILNLRLQDDAGVTHLHWCMGSPVNVIVSVLFPKPIQDPTFGVNILTDTGLLVAVCQSSHYGLKIGRIKGVVEYSMRIDQLMLYPRQYVIEPWVADAADLSNLDWVHNAAALLVTTGPSFLRGAVIKASQGVAFVKSNWKIAFPNASPGTGQTDNLLAPDPAPSSR